MRGAHLRPAPDVLKAHGVGTRAEMKRTPVEDPVDRTDDRATIRGDRRKREQAHTGQTFGDLFRAEPPVRCVDPEQMRAGARVAPVEKFLQPFAIGWRLMHKRSKSRLRGWQALGASFWPAPQGG